LKKTSFKFSNENERKLARMISSFMHLTFNPNLQILTYLNPKLTHLGLIFDFLVLHTQKHQLKTTFFITTFSPWL